MGFNEPLFLFYVLPALVVTHFALGSMKPWRTSTLLVVSIAFYSWAEPRFVPLVLCSTAADFLLAKYLAPHRKSGVRRVLLAIGVIQNLAILFFYKYFDFMIHNANVVFHSNFSLHYIVLPLGVSFIVFEKISYLIDVSRGTCAPAERLRSYSLFVFLFPKLLAGPILKYHEMRDQILQPNPPSVEGLTAGFERFARGVIKKVLLADPLGTFVDQVFDTAPDAVGFGVAWLGLLCFTLQIYFDFSGYSDMAIGLARIFGFRLRENFATPYIARSLTEFWRRWHMSLTTWIKDYLYIPLGGNNGPSWLTYRNLWICFLLSGLWHGANWTFIIWGAYNGFFLTLDRIVFLRVLDRTNAYLANLITIIIVMFGWAIFRSPTIGYFGGFLATLLTPYSTSPPMYVPTPVELTVMIGVAVCALPRWPSYQRLARACNEIPVLAGLTTTATMALFCFACARAVSSAFHPFLYFRF